MAFARRRTTSTRPALLSMPVRIAACAGIAAALLSPWPARPAAQEEPPAADGDAAAAWLAALPPEPAFVCGTPELVARQTWSGVTRLPVIRMADEEEESPYGQPLWFDPQPRLIRADSTEVLAFNNFPIRGLGRDEFDYTDFFGSRGALRSVEFYRDARFTATWISNHEIGHQWADYWDWTEITDGIERKGWEPGGHTPLLFPGEVLLGAVLRPIRRVARADGSDDSEGASYVIERTPAPSVFHPTVLYRMGLIGAEEVPEMVVFEDQGQFEEEFATAPAIGTAVEGGTTAVHISDILGQHGTRSGPVDDSWRRVTIVVSRNELISAEEMDYWNFFAARHEARSGATTFGGMPAFHEATGGRATLDTTVERFDGSRIVNDPPLQVSNVPIDPGEFRGVRLDAEIPGSMRVGQTLTFAGAITSSDAADVVEVCVRQVHTGGPVDEEGNDTRVVTTCDEPAGNRFSMSLTFDRATRYGLQVDLATQADDADEPDITRSSFMTGITVQ